MIEREGAEAPTDLQADGATSQPATEPATEPAAEPVAEPAVEPDRRPTTDPDAEPTTGEAHEANAEVAEPGPRAAQPDAPAPEPVPEASEPTLEPEIAKATERDPAESTVPVAVDTPAAEAADSEPEAAAPAPPAPALPAAALPAAAPPAAVEPEAPRTVGRFVADALRAVGVRYAFTVPGESFLGLLEGLDAAGIRIVATRHEGAAAFMAEAHGQLTGRPAVCVATRAVGAANLAIGIHTARQDSTPMFALVGQVQRGLRGREAFQEIEQASTIGGLAVHAVEIESVAALPAALADAIRAGLSARPGPVLISLPEDLLDETLPAGTALEMNRPAPPRPEADDVRKVLQFLASAERPVILAGGGVLRARTSTDLRRLAELLDVPVIAGWRRGDVISNDHDLYLGMAGYGSPSVVRERLDRADAVLVLGCRLSETTSFGYSIPRAGQPWIHVDIEPIVEREGLPRPVLAVRSDARVFVRAAVVRLQNGVLDAARVDARRAGNAEDRAAWESATAVDDSPWTGAGVHPGHAVATLRRVLPDDAIVATDAGNFGLWLARHFRFRRPGTFLGPTSGAMGYGLPAAIAAALVHRDRAVVAVAGDGGFAMTMAELETAVRERAKVVAVVFDNERYGTIRMHQDARGVEAGIGTDLGPIDFAAVARAFGARGVKVESDAALEPALRQALAADRATVLHLPLDRRWVSPDQPAT